MTNTILITVACLTLIGLLVAVVLYFVAQKFKVEEDESIEIVEAILTGCTEGCECASDRFSFLPGWRQ